MLNHIDTVPEDRRQSMVDDVRRLLDADGLGRGAGLAVSARARARASAELRAEIADRVAAKKAARTRLEADLKAAARAGSTRRHGDGASRASSRTARVAALEDAFADAAGRAHRGRRRRAVDPAPRRPGHRLAGDLVAVSAPARPAQAAPPRPRRGRQAADRHGRARRCRSRRRCSGPGSTPRCGRWPTTSPQGLGRPWVDAVRRASTSRLDELGDRLDAALAGTDLGVAKIPWWAGAGAGAAVAADPGRARRRRAGWSRWR